MKLLPPLLPVQREEHTRTSERVPISTRSVLKWGFLLGCDFLVLVVILLLLFDCLVGFCLLEFFFGWLLFGWFLVFVGFF